MIILRLAATLIARRLIGHLITVVAIRVLARRFTPMLILAALAFPSAAEACSVCFGDPESPMTKGAAAGVYVMVGFISFVLMGIAGTACFWMVRGRRLAISQPTNRTGP